MTGRARITKRAGALLVALSLFAVVPAVPALGLSATACQVKDIETGVTRSSLQAAVTAATKGQHLTVRGVCHGTTLVPINLTITGIQPAGAARPTLDGDAAGSVLTIKGIARVTVRKLRITDGTGTPDCGPVCYEGGGILNRGTLTLDSVRVDHNTASNTGFAIFNYGTLTLTGSSSVDHNTGTGSGIYNVKSLTLSGSSSVHHNTGGNGAGIGNSGTLTLNDTASVHDNTSTSGGGGIGNSGTVTLNGASSVYHNAAATQGGGIDNSGLLSGSYCGTKVHDNTPDDCAP